jgi:DNA-3-methyladenine glycosylase I
VVLVVARPPPPPPVVPGVAVVPVVDGEEVLVVDPPSVVVVVELDGCVVGSVVGGSVVGGSVVGGSVVGGAVVAVVGGGSVNGGSVGSVMSLGSGFGFGSGFGLGFGPGSAPAGAAASVNARNALESSAPARHTRRASFRRPCIVTQASCSRGRRPLTARRSCSSVRTRRRGPASHPREAAISAALPLAVPLLSPLHGCETCTCREVPRHAACEDAGMDERAALVRGDDGARRCTWATSAPEYVAYHDDEWGRPVTDDRRLFEKLCLEGFQSGLSWLTILRKREGFRRAFAQFDVERVARFGDRDVERLMNDAAIVRNRAKIEATIANAHATIAVQRECGSLAALVWSFEPRGRRRAPKSLADVMPTTAESKALSKALQKFGFRFVGPTTCYAAMQSLGLVNDHFTGCHVRGACERDRAAMVRP